MWKPFFSNSSVLVTRYYYTIKSEVTTVKDPLGVGHHTFYNDWGAVWKKTGDSRGAEYSYNSSGQLHKTSAFRLVEDPVTENVYGVTRGTAAGDSRIASNELVAKVKYPAEVGDTDEVEHAYDAQGEPIWTKDQNGTQHVYQYDARGRMIHDRVTVLAWGVAGDVRRTSTTYDALDRQLKVTNYDDHTPGSPDTVVDEVEYEYDKFGVIKTYYQARSGAVNTSTSPKVSYAYDFPTDGTTGLRRTSTTYPSGEVITDEYNSGVDDTLSRLSGRKNGTAWVFEESYLGMDRLVEREYGGQGVKWRLTGFGTPDSSGFYPGLDNFGRIDSLKVGATASGEINHIAYSYNYNSQVTERDNDVPGNMSWNESFQYDGIGRLIEHWRNEELPEGWGPFRLHECWTYEGASYGNVVTEYYYGDLNACTDTIAIDVNLSHEIETYAGVANDHSASGEMTEQGTNCDQIFDAWGRLCEVQIDSLVIATYSYDGLGQKVARADSPTRDDTYYFYSPSGQVLEELKVSNGDRIHSYVWGTQNIDDIVMRIDDAANSEKYYVLDVNNNVISRLDYQGNVFQRYTYCAYGYPDAWDDDWNWRNLFFIDELSLFTGRTYHLDHAQYDYRARWMDPYLEVFVTRDPIGIWGDPASGGNGYLYAGGDPVNGRDPWGLRATFPVSCTWEATFRSEMELGPGDQVPTQEDAVARIASAIRVGQAVDVANLFQVRNMCTCKVRCPEPLCPLGGTAHNVPEGLSDVNGFSFQFPVANSAECNASTCGSYGGPLPSWECEHVTHGLRQALSPVEFFFILYDKIRFWIFYPARGGIRFMRGVNEYGKKLVIPPSPIQVPPAPLPK